MVTAGRGWAAQACVHLTFFPCLHYAVQISALGIMPVSFGRQATATLAVPHAGSAQGVSGCSAGESANCCDVLYTWLARAVALHQPI